VEVDPGYGLIWGYTAKLAAFAGEKRLDKIGRTEG